MKVVCFDASEMDCFGRKKRREERMRVKLMAYLDRVGLIGKEMILYNEEDKLIHAVKEGNLEKVKRMLCKSFDPNSANRFDWTLLHFAVFNGTV